MKKIIIVALLVIGSVIATIAAEVGVYSILGKERLASLPLVGGAFTFESEKKEIVEIEDARYTEVDEMVANLKKIIDEKDAVQTEQMQTNERLKNEIKKLRTEIASMDSEINRKLVFIDSHRAEGLQEMAAMYESTNPTVVAGIFENLKDEECAAILRFMRERQAAKVIEAYTMLGNDEIARNDNSKRMAEITKIMQKLVQESLIETP